jgi:hypothetical protein
MKTIDICRLASSVLMIVVCAIAATGFVGAIAILFLFPFIVGFFLLSWYPSIWRNPRKP